jgi:hypothetical protein
VSLVAHLPEGTIIADGFDDCVVGYASRSGEIIVVYDRDACIKSLSVQSRLQCDSTESCDVDHDAEAEEFFEYNTQRASDYLGAKAPVYVTLLKGVEA